MGANRESEADGLRQLHARTLARQNKRAHAAIMRPARPLTLAPLADVLLGVLKRAPLHLPAGRRGTAVACMLGQHGTLQHLSPP